MFISFRVDPRQPLAHCLEKKKERKENDILGYKSKDDSERNECMNEVRSVQQGRGGAMMHRTLCPLGKSQDSSDCSQDFGGSATTDGLTWSSRARGEHAYSSPCLQLANAQGFKSTWWSTSDL